MQYEVINSCAVWTGLYLYCIIVSVTCYLLQANGPIICDSSFLLDWYVTMCNNNFIYVADDTPCSFFLLLRNNLRIYFTLRISTNFITPIMLVKKFNLLMCIYTYVFCWYMPLIIYFHISLSCRRYEVDRHFWRFYSFGDTYIIIINYIII